MSWAWTAAAVVLLSSSVGLATAHVAGGEQPAETQYVWTAVTLSILSGMAATLGGLIVVMIGMPSKPVLGHLLSFSAGVMLFISYADLLVHSAAAETTSNAQAVTWMFLGMLGFWLVASLVPEPDIESLATTGSDGLALQAPDKMTLAELRLELADAGSESSASTAGTRTELVSKVEAARSKISSGASSASSSKLMLTGLIACIGISLHNLPEGLIVYTQTLSGVCREPWAGWAPDALAGFMQGCMGRGVAITMAMALHNIPEGMAVAAPVLAATGSKWEALKWCFLSSIVEPVGAIVMGVAFQDSITEETQSVLEAVVSGIMVMLCLMELMPTAAEYAGARAAAVSNLVGQAAIFFGLSFFH